MSLDDTARERGYMEKVRDCLRRNSGLLHHLQKKIQTKGGSRGHTPHGSARYNLEVVMVIRTGVMFKFLVD